MSFQVRSEQRQHSVWILENKESNIRAEICPALGFNCFRWTVNSTELLYHDAGFLEGSPPTRSGMPILFPFPNRIRAGLFSWEGKEYRLPLQDPAGQNAIHGFVVRRPWRVVDHGADAASAWITGEFWGARDAPECATLWPADYRIRVTHRLVSGELRTEAVVDNPDRIPLPFGLGYHHYFAIEESDRVQAFAPFYWELVDCLPTGKRSPVDRERDLNRARPFSELKLDDVLTDLPGPAGNDRLYLRGVIQRGRAGKVELWTSADFRELVVFTPPHRRAICLEPYTCLTDALNLNSRGMDAGLRVLHPGESWCGTVSLQHVAG